MNSSEQVTYTVANIPSAIDDGDPKRVILIITYTILCLLAATGNTLSIYVFYNWHRESSKVNVNHIN